MNDTSLERILEEAFQTVLRSNFSGEATEPLASMSSAPIDVSNSVDVSFIHVGRSQNTHLIDTHIFYQNYQENMRLYQNNVSMMVRHLQSVGRNPSRQRLRHDHDFHHFPFYGVLGTGSLESYEIPTINQFTSATEYCIYHRETMGDTRSCPITLDEFQENEQICRIRHCGHIFKSSALQNWFSRNAHCPVCRHDIRRQHAISNPII